MTLPDAAHFPLRLTVLASWPRLLLLTFERLGLPANQLALEAGLNIEQLADANARIPSMAVVQLWRLGLAQTDANLPLAIAEHVNAGTFHALGFAMASSETGRDALDLLQRYYSLLTTTIQLHRVERPGQSGLRMHSSALLHHLLENFAEAELNDSLGQLREAGALALVSLCRHYFGVRFAPHSVIFHRDLGASRNDYARVLGCPVHDNGDQDTIWFDNELLDRPLPSANAHLATVNEQVVASYLRLLHQDWPSQVVSEIILQMPDGKVSQNSVAEALHLSSRTLQRRLNDANVSFRELLQQARQELAVQYIRHSDIPILEIGYRLGFSEPANFTRAFRQWTGEAPARYRARARNAAL
ncbi:AraC family transcriptional regulator [Saccharospirillum mangrovi]|uniref:AraC family transcriptional regulator n=1 Tax=Saccharospirillum mangrovi TaxID=2161747 RepID=UPI000D39C798|nr:AraC family transcriptional regulator [Saccharospirillum mangrovi]